MTYFTYHKTQYTPKYTTLSAYDDYRRCEKSPHHIPSVLLQPNFMPSYLVRTSDMKVVKGSEVHEGYWTLSYSWNQSGEILINKTTGKSYRIDQGKHKIVFTHKTAPKRPRGRKRISDRSKFVKFEGLVQQICKDFNIKYIWYDQMCINQDNEKEKRNEIHQMHKIYSNTYCTLALMPELGTGTKPNRHRFVNSRWIDGKAMMGSQWMKRMWTLQETLLSPRMLVVGRNIHLLGDYVSESYIPNFGTGFDCSASTLLHFAHTRTSTKEHDLIFALANIFPDVMKQITVDYEQDILELIIQFYGLLAKKDIRILCFGPYSFYQTTCKISSYKSTKDKGSEKEDFYIPIQKYNLPSWTGVNGEHNYWKIDKPSFENYTVNGRVLEITCRAFTNDEQRTESLTLQSIYDKIPPFPQNYTNNRYKGILTIRLTLQDSSKEKFIEIGLGWHDQHYDSNDYHEIIKNVWNFSHFLPMEKMDFRWTVYSGSEIFIPEFKFDKLTEKLQNSGQYAILTGVPFTHNSGIIQFSQYPVVKKEGDYYKAIGVCDIDNDEGHFFDGIELEEQTFRIH